MHYTVTVHYREYAERMTKAAGTEGPTLSCLLMTVTTKLFRAFNVFLHF